MKRFIVIIGCLLIFIGLSNLEAAIFVVTNTADAGAGSLRQAILAANANAGRDTINFNISGPGPHTIFVLSQLPILSDPNGVLIDGLTQPGSNPGANPPTTAVLMVVVDGANAGPAHGFWILSPAGTAHDNRIQGLVINNFSQDGIRIQATPVAGTYNNYVYCNFIGTDQAGLMAQGNGWNQQRLWAGVEIVCTPDTAGLAFDNVVDANLISANYAEGVSISNCPPGDVLFNTVMLNYIGTDVTGTADLGNVHDGVYIGEGAHDNSVDGNLISGNDFEGVCIVGYAEAIPPVSTDNNIVLNNIIGLDIGSGPLPNTRDGVSIGQYGIWYQGGYARSNQVLFNTIAYNGRNGVVVWEHQSSMNNCDGNIISQNSIYDNNLLGIDLADNGVTANDMGDPDVGPNQELNFPVITSAVNVAGQTTITGTLDIDTDPTQASVEVFRARLDPTGFGEGERYEGSATPDPVGNWTLIVNTLNPGDLVTATTSDLNANTSEFCLNFNVVIGIEEGDFAGKPWKFRLSQSQPNPFSKRTSIQYTVAKTTHVSLKIYDISGKLVKTLVNEIHTPSHYTVHWDGQDGSGKKISSGIYFYKLDTRDFKDIKKLILTR
jgi:hypothetical protein